MRTSRWVSSLFSSGASTDLFVVGAAPGGRRRVAEYDTIVCTRHTEYEYEEPHPEAHHCIHHTLLLVFLDRPSPSRTHNHNEHDNKPTFFWTRPLPGGPRPNTVRTTCVTVTVTLDPIHRGAQQPCARAPACAAWAQPRTRAWRWTRTRSRIRARLGTLSGFETGYAQHAIGSGGGSRRYRTGPARVARLAAAACAIWARGEQQQQYGVQQRGG
jgi:hypothetical protein